MHSHNLESWTHEHVFLGQHHARNEARTWAVVAITAAMMVAEIAGGSIYGSMALTADGWHMSTHAAALGVAGFAYLYARRHARDPRYAFGTGKVGELAAFTSAVVLAIVAVLIAYESVLRLIHPVPIAYGEAMAIAAVGLVVNVVSAWLLSDDHAHHGHGHAHGHAVMTTTTMTTTTIMTTTITTTTVIIAISICAPPIRMSWRMRRRRCWRSAASASAGPSAGRRSTRWSAWSAPRSS